MRRQDIALRSRFTKKGAGGRKGGGVPTAVVFVYRCVCTTCCSNTRSPLLPPSTLNGHTFFLEGYFFSFTFAQLLGGLLSLIVVAGGRRGRGPIFSLSSLPNHNNWAPPRSADGDSTTPTVLAAATTLHLTYVRISTYVSIFSFSFSLARFCQYPLGRRRAREALFSRRPPTEETKEGDRRETELQHQLPFLPPPPPAQVPAEVLSLSNRGRDCCCGSPTSLFRSVPFCASASSSSSSSSSPGAPFFLPLLPVSVFQLSLLPSNSPLSQRWKEVPPLLGTAPPAPRLSHRQTFETSGKPKEASLIHIPRRTSGISLR